MTEDHYSKITIVSFLLSIFGFVWMIVLASIIERFFSSFTIVGGYILFTLGILFGIFGLILIKKNNELKGRNLAWYGIILGILGIIATFFTRPFY